TLTQELVLGSAQPDPLGPALAGAGGVLTGIGVCSYRHPPRGIRVGEEPVYGGDEFGDVVVRRDLQRGLEPLGDVDRGGGVDDVHLPGEYLTGGAVDRDDLPLGQGVLPNAHGAGLVVDVEFLGPDDGAGAHAAGDDR